MTTERFRPLVPDMYDDPRLFGDRPEPAHLGITMPASEVDPTQPHTVGSSFSEYVRQRNEQLAAQKRAERWNHIRRAKDAGSFVFRHKAAALTGVAVVGAAAVGGRLLRRK